MLSFDGFKDATHIKTSRAWYMALWDGAKAIVRLTYDDASGVDDAWIDVVAGEDWQQRCRAVVDSWEQNTRVLITFLAVNRQETTEVVKKLTGPGGRLETTLPVMTIQRPYVPTQDEEKQFGWHCVVIVPASGTIH